MLPGQVDLRTNNVSDNNLQKEKKKIKVIHFAWWMGASLMKGKVGEMSLT